MCVHRMIYVSQKPTSLSLQEQRAAPKRLAAIDELLQRQKQRERDLQKRYKELQDQHHQLKLATSS